jgi:hypothetical protein
MSRQQKRRPMRAAETAKVRAERRVANEELRRRLQDLLEAVEDVQEYHTPTHHELVSQQTHFE